MSARTIERSERRIRRHERAITRVLRRRESEEYFKNGGWTNDPEEADSFEDVVEAAEACIRHGLSEVDLALRLHSSASDLFCTRFR